MATGKRCILKDPIEVNNSSIPAWVSKLAPINITAFSFGPWIFCRGIFSTRLRQHETIHYRQQIELLFIFQWLLYITFWLVLFVKYRDGRAAYRNNAFEREAYDNDIDPHYLETRKPFAWIRYLCDFSREP